MTYSGAPGGRTLSFSGRLLDANGAPVNGTRNLSFTLYDGDGTALHNEASSSSIQDGLIRYQLGTNALLTSGVFDGYDGFNRSIGVSVDGGPEVGRIALNNSGLRITGSGFEIQDATSISAYTDVMTYSGAPDGRTLSFSGLLLDENGAPVNGTRNLSFTLYDGDGTALHNEASSSSIQNGLISYQLGTNALLTSDLFDGYDGFNRFIGFSIGGNELGRFSLNSSSPAQLTAVPEPSSLFLSAVSMFGLALTCRRRSRTCK